MGRFFADVSGFVRRSKNAMDFVTKDAAQTAFHEAQLEGPSIGNGSPGKGGRMPRVSGFLRSTGVASVNSVPSGPSRQVGDGPFAWDASAAELVILNSQPGDVIYFGWSAAYARRMEEKYGFVQATAMRWQGFVDNSAKKARVRFSL